MKLAFSTLACPDWSMPEIIAMALSAGYQGIELRFVEGEDSLWKLPVFQGERLAATRGTLADQGLTIACVDTSCRFHFQDPGEREKWITEGRRMMDLAAALGAPGIRVFGDSIQPGANRESTRGWIAESIQTLAEKTKGNGVQIWLETHGDFASASETIAILREAASLGTGVIWDPMNCFLEAGENPAAGASVLGTSICHVHIKDMERGTPWTPVLTGEGDFALDELLAALQRLRYDGCLSFEWEKKWHPAIADADVALPHFVAWITGELNS